MCKYSLIIPVYNTEKYLNQCVDSCLNQTFKDFEIILVDDGSKDSSPLICDDYANKFSNIKVIHIKNSGVSFARNIGIDACCGKYVCFVDSDDEISNTYLEAADKAIDNCDMLVMNFTRNISKLSKTNEPLNQYVLTDDDKKELVLSVVQKANGKLKKNINCNTTTAKVFKTSVIKENNIKFEVGIKIAEDKLFNFNLYPHLENIKYLDNIVYYARENPKSATRGYMPRCFDTNMKAILEIKKKIYDETDESLRKELYERYCGCLAAVERNCLTTDYCNKMNKNKYIQRKSDFERDFRNSEISAELVNCNLGMFTSYEKYLFKVFRTEFFIINIIMKHRLLRIIGYYIYKLF